MNYTPVKDLTEDQYENRRMIWKRYNHKRAAQPLDTKLMDCPWCPQPHKIHKTNSTRHKKAVLGPKKVKKSTLKEASEPGQQGGFVRK